MNQTTKVPNLEFKTYYYRYRGQFVVEFDIYFEFNSIRNSKLVTTELDRKKDFSLLNPIQLSYSVVQPGGLSGFSPKSFRTFDVKMQAFKRVWT